MVYDILYFGQQHCVNADWKKCISRKTVSHIIAFHPDNAAAWFGRLSIECISVGFNRNPSSFLYANENSTMMMHLSTISSLIWTRALDTSMCGVQYSDGEIKTMYGTEAIKMSIILHSHIDAIRLAKRY